MKNIDLGNGFVIIVDDADYEYLNQWKWHADKRHKTFYARRRDYSMGKPGKLIYMHRLILKAKDGEHVDHRDGNGLNNSRSNIRICSHAQNIRYSGKKKNNTSGYNGVSFDKSRNKWTASIGHNFKVIHLGRYKTPEEAAIAYNTKAVELNGEFAKLNIIP